MNLIEAIKKTKETHTTIYVPFTWSYRSNGLGQSLVSCTPGVVDPDFLLAIIGQISEHCLLRDDWEIQEPTVTITRTQLLQALSTTPIGGAYHMGGEAFNEIARKLGLED